MKNKAQSEIITTVLIIILVLAAIVIFWQIIKSFNPNPSNYYDHSDTYCAHYNMTEKNTPSGQYDMCYKIDGDKIIRKDIYQLGGRYYFVENSNEK